MIPQPPPGQGPIDPRGALMHPPAPGMPEMAMTGQPAPAMQGVNNMQNATGPQPIPPAGYPPAGYPPAGAPPWGPMYPPPRRRGGIGRIILFLVLLFALVGSVLLNVLLLQTGSVGRSDGAQSNVIQPGDSHKVIAVIPLEGIIDEATETKFERYVSWARDDENVKGAIVLIDTPGGTVTASDEIYKRIKKFRSEKNVPVVVSMRGMGTSGGYYAACAADHIIAERNTLTGNIGVIMPSYNFSKFLDKYGIDDSTIVATGATYKDAGSWTRAPTQEHQQYLQSEIDASFAIFKQVVLDGRKNKLKGKAEDIFNGKAFMGEEALKLGLIDDIDDTGYLDAAIKYVSQQAGITGPQVIKYHEPPINLLNLLASSKTSGPQAANGGITINLDASLIDRLSARRVMYLYTGPR